MRWDQWNHAANFLSRSKLVVGVGVPVLFFSFVVLRLFLSASSFGSYRDLPYLHGNSRNGNGHNNVYDGGNLPRAVGRTCVVKRRRWQMFAFTVVLSQHQPGHVA